MNLRKALTLAAITLGITGAASATQISITYTATLPATATDLYNHTLNLQGWDPGDATQTTASTVATGSVTMASLNQAGYTYTLESYDITLTSTLAGSFTLTNNGGLATTGTLGIDTINAAALGSDLNPDLSNVVDPANDLFHGADADPTTSKYTVNAPANGGTFTSPTFSKVASADTGTITSNLANVSSTPLTLYISSTSEEDSSLQNAGNTSIAYNTTLAEVATITYTFDAEPAAPTPEPATMLLFGSALVGVGLLRKRAKQQ